MYKRHMLQDSRQDTPFRCQGFFDNVNHARMTADYTTWALQPDLVAWASSFLAERRIRTYASTTSFRRTVQPVGVPQGSPLSPVLSIAYTAPLLGKMANWNNSSLGMYIDDGLLFACAENGTTSPNSSGQILGLCGMANQIGTSNRTREDRTHVLPEAIRAQPYALTQHALSSHNRRLTHTSQYTR
jgi:hypothetical protein